MLFAAWLAVGESVRHPGKYYENNTTGTLALLNLLKNGAEAIDGAKLPPSRRHIELRVMPRHMPDQGGTIEFSVQDSGPGLPEEVLSRMFEAFYSTKVDMVCSVMPRAANCAVSSSTEPWVVPASSLLRTTSCGLSARCGA